jgi:TonB-linked SusC/RagA family outer membrane protein
MRFNQILLRRTCLISLVLIGIFSSSLTFGQRSADKKVEVVTINIKVADDLGSPVPGAQVVLGEGVRHLESDLNGSVSFQATTNDMISVSKSGYEKVTVRISELLTSGLVTIKRAKLFKTNEDLVPLPFYTSTKRNITSGTVVVRGNQLEKYPSTDLRNGFTGLVPGLEVIENNGSTGLSPEEKVGYFNATERVSLYMRGRKPLIVVDGMPSDINEIPMDAQEIESASVIKDITGKVMFGPQAADGLILIETKRGVANERILNINMEGGASIIDRFPGWSTGAEFADLNNTARANSGLTPLYSIDDISAYSLNDPYNMYHPSSDYQDLMLDNSKSYQRVNLSSRGGNDIVQYFAYVGYNGEGDIYEMGSKSDYNKLNTRANLDIKVTNNFKLKFNFFGGLTFRRSINYGYSPNYGADNSSDATLDIIEFDRAIRDITTTSPIAFPIYANNDPELKSPWYGVTADFPNNPVARQTRNGYYTESSRIGKVSAILEYDFSNFIKGLKSTTFVGLDGLYLIRIGKATDYFAYNVIPSETSLGADTIILTKAHDGVDMSTMAKLHDYYYQRLAFYENLNFSRSVGMHDFNTAITYYVYKNTRNQIEEPQREQSLLWTGNYSYNDKYNIQAVLNYTGTYSYDTTKRQILSPSLGASWIISDENFMSGLKFIDYLKIRTEIGMTGAENFDNPFLYRDNWSYNTSGAVFGPYSTNQWFGSTQDNQVYRSAPVRTGNPDISWEKRKEFNAGIDALLFNDKLSLDFTYYYNLIDGEIAQLSNSMPFIVGISSAIPYYNYNKTAYYGIETGLNYAVKAGDLLLNLGGTAVFQQSKIIQYDEPNYRFEYQSRIGKPADSYWGHTFLGTFESDAEAESVVQVYDPILHQGDLKYADNNSDNIIDDNDMSNVGHVVPRLYYSLNLRANWKGLELTIIGTGRAFYDIPTTNSYFWNGWGDNNYSDFVRNNLGGAYPRLTYYKVNNNFVNSDFWLTKGGYFKIQNVELAYSIPSKILKIPGMQMARLFLRGANLLTISSVDDVDPESVDSGVYYYPLFKTITGGFSLNF